jgi:hypothetical protein
MMALSYLKMSLVFVVAGSNEKQLSKHGYGNYLPLSLYNCYLERRSHKHISIAYTWLPLAVISNYFLLLSLI